MERVEIPLKLPSCNQYIDVCRTNYHKAAKLKKDTERDIGLFLKRLPKYDKPIYIHFHWIERIKNRDLDGISFGKKFILDAMQKEGKIDNDDAKHVVGFKDTFEYGNEYKVILEIYERE